MKCKLSVRPIFSEFLIDVPELSDTEIRCTTSRLVYETSDEGDEFHR